MVYLSQCQLTDGNVALEPDWDRKHNLEVTCLAIKVGEISKVSNENITSRMYVNTFSRSVKHFIFKCSLFF